MFKNVSAKDTATAATYLYLKAIGAKVTKSTVEETLKNHPEYPSLLAASDVLNKWNIENIALQISPEKLSEIPTPFLVYLQIDGGIFSVVKSIKENIVEWIDIKQKLRKISIEEFILMWNGIVLVAEVNGKSGEKNYLENYKKEVKSKLQNRLLFLSALLLISCFFYYNFSSDWNYNTFLITKFTGILISSLLLWQSLDKDNPFIKTLC